MAMGVGKPRKPIISGFVATIIKMGQVVEHPKIGAHSVTGDHVRIIA